VPDSASLKSLAVIGAGVSGCALIARLRQLRYRGPIDLWETGRGPGGRASTRRSRRDSGLQIDHGAPLLNIGTTPPPALLEPLLAHGHLVPWSGRIARLQGESRLQLDGSDALTEGELFRGHGGMDRIGAGLLTLAREAGTPSVRTHFSTLVRALRSGPQGRWQLLDPAGTLLGESDWLVLSSTLLAHPRTGSLFGWPTVPLKEAAESLGDLQLDHALTTIAGIRSEARSNLLVVLDPTAALPWLTLPFRLLSFDAAAQQRWGLRRVSIQPLADQRCAVVAHSTNAFAADHLDVYGSQSAIATQLQLPPDSGREDTVIKALTELLDEAMTPFLGSPSGLQDADRQLMRWGAAFPVAPGLPLELTVCPDSKVGFCGDYVNGAGFGRIEGALRSAEMLAERLMPVLQSPRLRRNSR
jgi:predicted NAD/FAD-dependent oxidoreductase